MVSFLQHQYEDDICGFVCILLLRYPITIVSKS